MNRRANYFLSISFLALSAFVAVGFVSSHPGDWPFAEHASFHDVRNLCGPLGSLLAGASFALFGRFFAWILPAGLGILGVGVALGRSGAVLKGFVKALAIVVLMTVFFALIPVTAGSTRISGSIGTILGGMLAAVLGRIGSTILVITSLLLVLLGEVRYVSLVGLGVFRRAGRWSAGAARLFERVASAAGRGDGPRARRPAAAGIEERRAEAEIIPAGARRLPEDVPWLGETRERQPPAAGAAVVLSPPVRPRARKRPASPSLKDVSLEDAELPPLSILNRGESTGALFTPEQLRAWSGVLEDKLGNYGINGRVTAVNQGPLVTTFEFEPAAGVKVRDIVSRADDLALAMRARSLRLIAPIPGRAVVGIEVPNPEPAVVFFRDVFGEIPDRLRYTGIMLACGADAVGKAFTVNLCAAPHLLMAGTTGSGKSVALNAFLASILFQYRPSDVRLLIIDPKMVEMTLYNGIPHLLHPVITDPRDAVRVFHYLIGEMGRRNRLLNRHGVKNIESFNSKLALGRIDADEQAPQPEKLPYIVLVVDELADLVLTKGADFESLLSRLSNMARAVGIHMIVATQRPSVDVIDGKTKANFPTRIAFRVATKVDSRTILDCVGAEKLIGRGDMLYVDAKHPEALRLHGAWITEEELEELVAHWKQYDFEEAHLDLYEEAPGAVGESDRDAYFDDARNIVLQYRQGSTSLLQRKLHVGYARAARLLDQLEQAGIVGPPEGSKAREVLVRPEEEFTSNMDD